MLGPTGIGVLYGKKEILQKMSPFEGGGEMIKEVSFTKAQVNATFPGMSCPGSLRQVHPTSAVQSV